MNEHAPPVVPGKNVGLRPDQVGGASSDSLGIGYDDSWPPGLGLDELGEVAERSDSSLAHDLLNLRRALRIMTGSASWADASPMSTRVGDVIELERGSSAADVDPFFAGTPEESSSGIPNGCAVCVLGSSAEEPGKAGFADSRTSSEWQKWSGYIGVSVSSGSEEGGTVVVRTEGRTGLKRVFSQFPRGVDVGAPSPIPVRPGAVYYVGARGCLEDAEGIVALEASLGETTRRWAGVGLADGTFMVAPRISQKGFDGPAGEEGFEGTVGTSGFSGTSGASGFSAFSGFSGTSGASGFSAFSGSSGASGTAPSGNSGFGGPAGTSGHSGKSGVSGTSGTSGATGRSGASGTSGASGAEGPSGASGRSGESGKSGFSGASGASGASGWSGTSGWSGASGWSGLSGFSGFSNASGSSGVSGASGLSGKSGIATSGFSGFASSGFSGASGKTGMSGTTGQPGATEVMKLNVLKNWTFEDGDSGGAPLGWSFVRDSGGSGSAESQSGDSHHGSWACLVSGSGSAGVSKIFQTAPGLGASAGVAVRVKADKDTSGDAASSVSLVVYSAGEGPEHVVGTSQSASVTMSDLAAFDEWTTLAVVNGPSSSHVRVSVELANAAGASESVLVDSCVYQLALDVNGTFGGVGPAATTTSGRSGRSGWSGAIGTSAFSGASGEGPSGTSGYRGVLGGSGHSGTSGASGVSGKSGASGMSGLSGPSGVAGIPANIIHNAEMEAIVQTDGTSYEYETSTAGVAYTVEDITSGMSAFWDAQLPYPWTYYQNVFYGGSFGISSITGLSRTSLGILTKGTTITPLTLRLISPRVSCSGNAPYTAIWTAAMGANPYAVSFGLTFRFAWFSSAAASSPLSTSTLTGHNSGSINLLPASSVFNSLQASNYRGSATSPSGATHLEWWCEMTVVQRTSLPPPAVDTSKMYMGAFVDSVAVVPGSWGHPSLSYVGPGRPGSSGKSGV